MVPVWDVRVRPRGLTIGADHGARGGGGGALRYQMATHCQTATWSGGGERQNIGAVYSFEGKKGGRSTSN